MNNRDFWKKIHRLPMQQDFLDMEEINPAEAYRKQAEAINVAGPLYAELESLENRLNRVTTTQKSLKSQILAQNMPISSTATRTNDLIDAFVLSAAKNFKDANGHTKDITDSMLNLEKLRSSLELRISQTARKLKALEDMADKCDRIMNWAKHEARLEYKS